MPKSNIKDYLHLHFIVFIWGFTAVLGKLITIDAIPLVWFRLAVASVVLFFFLMFKRVDLKINTRAFFLFLIGGFLIGLHWIAFFYAIKIATVSITLATLATGALFTSLLEPIFFKTKFKWYEILLSLLTVVGIVIIFNVCQKTGKFYKTIFSFRVFSCIHYLPTKQINTKQNHSKINSNSHCSCVILCYSLTK